MSDELFREVDEEVRGAVGAIAGHLIRCISGNSGGRVNDLD